MYVSTGIHIFIPQRVRARYGEEVEKSCKYRGEGKKALCVSCREVCIVFTIFGFAVRPFNCVKVNIEGF
jgi:hypothetical protein